MRAVNYFIKRFEYAAKGNGTIKLNQNDIDALNQIINFYNTNYKNTELEDSLLLFYILQNWKVENRNNEAIMLKKQDTNGNIMEISDSIHLLKKICISLYPKKHIYNQIATELWAHQAYNKVPKEKWITEKEVEKLLERELHIAKNHFSFAKEIDKGNAIFGIPNFETEKLESEILISEMRNRFIVKEKLKSISEKLNYSDSEEIYQTLCKELL
jgi:hypothetical protein